MRGDPVVPSFRPKHFEYESPMLVTISNQKFHKQLRFRSGSQASIWLSAANFRSALVSRHAGAPR